MNIKMAAGFIFYVVCSGFVGASLYSCMKSHNEAEVARTACAKAGGVMVSWGDCYAAKKHGDYCEMDPINP
jgi:hypothetical protein